MTDAPRPSAPKTPDSSPLADWFGRHGIKAIAVLVLIELAFHGWAVTSAGRRERREASTRTASPASAATVDTLPREGALSTTSPSPAPR